MSKHLERFDTPPKRVGFLIFVSSVISLVTVLLFTVDWTPFISGHYFDRFGYRLFRFYSFWFYANLIGIIAGFVFAYQYDATVARLLRWVKSGKSN